MVTIAVVEDDVPIGDVVEQILRREGYAVLRAYSGTEALYLLQRQRPDLVLLDLMLPGLSGEELLPQIRDLPVIVLSAKAEVQDKVALLLGGAVDYLTKPFHAEELLARIAVQLRRAQTPPDRLAAGELQMDLTAQAVTAGGVPVKLTRTEYAILKRLMIDPDRAVAKSVLLERISLDTPDCTERSLKQHISNLRHKLQAATGTDYIETIWGVGFKLRKS